MAKKENKNKKGVATYETLFMSFYFEEYSPLTSTFLRNIFSPQ